MQNIAELLKVTGPPIRSEPHDFAFVSVVWKSQKLRRRGIDDACRMRIFHGAQNLDTVPIPAAPHRAEEVSKSVNREDRSAVEARYQETTGHMGLVVFDVVKSRPQV